MEKQLKIIVEKHPDGYVAYPLGLKGVVVAQGDTYQVALDDVRSAIAFHVQTFGEESITDGSPVIEAFVAEAGVAICHTSARATSVRVSLEASSGP